MSDPFAARWAVPVRDGLVQPVVPVVTALLAGLLIGVTSDPQQAASAARGASIVLPAPAPAPAPPPIAGPVGPLPLLPAPTVPEAPPVPVATPTPAPAPATAPSTVAAAPSSPPTPATKRPPAPEKERARIKHVFLITLSDQSEQASYGAGSKAPFLARKLTAAGLLLPNYFAVTRGELPNLLALLSGQGPTPQLQQGCAVFSDVAPATAAADGQELGDGCVHTAASGSIAEQITGLGKPWAAYVDGMGTACRHPAIGAPDDAANPAPGAPYSTDRNPLVHFHGVIDDAGGCARHVKDLGTLTADLRKPARGFPLLSVITPSRCEDGSDTPCVAGAAAGLGPADAFLKRWVTKIRASAAYRDGGLIAITTDQAPDAAGTGATGASGASGTTGATAATGATAVSGTSGTTGVSRAVGTSGASGPTGSTGGTGATGSTGVTGTRGATGFQPVYPNLPPGGASGGQVGLLLLSPDLAAPGSTLADSANHFDLLHSLAELLGVTAPGYAADPQVTGLPLDTILVKR